MAMRDAQGRFVSAGASFSADISQFVRKSQLNANLVMRSLAMQAYTGVLIRSPVDEGRFRGSWRVGIQAPDLSVESEGSAGAAEGTRKGSPMTAQEAQKAENALRTVSIGDTVYVTNNLPYAKRLEDGHSGQTEGPNNIVGGTYQELRGNIRGLVASVLT